MSRFNSNFIDAYRTITGPLRAWRLKQMVANGTVPIGVLFYHRVDDDYPNPWTISQSDFAQQIDWFQENFDLISLEECQQRMRNERNERPALSITFDDGYADNCSFALPMLVERKIPVTYFVTTHHTLEQKPFPHDVELGQCLGTNTPESLAEQLVDPIHVLFVELEPVGAKPVVGGHFGCLRHG